MLNLASRQTQPAQPRFNCAQIVLNIGTLEKLTFLNPNFLCLSRFFKLFLIFLKFSDEQHHFAQVKSHLM